MVCFRAKAVVFDVDGVLVDCSGRLEACLSEAGAVSIERLRGKARARFWECFLSERFAYLDKPRREYAGLALDYASRGYAVLIVTGRPESMREVTLAQLRELGLAEAVREIVFRKRGDRRSEWIVKAEAVKKLAERYDIEVVYDDSERVIEELRRAMPRLRTVLV